MTAKSAQHPDRRMTMVPVTTMEEFPVLDDDERAKLRVSLADAEASIEAGEGIEYDPSTFKDRLIGIYRSNRSQE